MTLTAIANELWGKKAKFRYLFIAAIILLFTCLGAREIWTQEHRWADIVAGMFFRHDFLHPYLGQATYYDKPLLSYWLIALLAKISGQLSIWVLRLPSACAGLLAIWSIYRLGTRLGDKSLGLLSGWLLLTTYFFLFWARISSADMLNVAGTLFAIAWYFDRKDHAGFFDYAIFFLIVAVTCLCKGLIGAAVPVIAVATDMFLNHTWKQHLRWPLFLALIPALIVYIIPFWASSHFGGAGYGENGLYLVYRENVLRYFQPFDHKGPIYTYFLYLPIYTLPWAFFFIPALCFLASRWHNLSINSKWIAWTLLLVFIFLTASGSRRSYYVLPLVPFAILFTADWILASGANRLKREAWASGVMIFSLLFLFLAIDIVPAWYYSKVGVNQFASLLKTEAEKSAPWDSWNVVMLDAESKLDFYLQMPPNVRHYDVKGDREAVTGAAILSTWPILQAKPSHTIFVSRQMYLSLLLPYFSGYRVVEIHDDIKVPGLKMDVGNLPVAFIPVAR